MGTLGMESILDDLEDDWQNVIPQVDWAAKKWLLETFIQEENSIGMTLGLKARISNTITSIYKADSTTHCRNRDTWNA